MARDIVAYCNGLSKAEFWSLEMGDVQNLLDEALEEVERLRGFMAQYHEVLMEEWAHDWIGEHSDGTGAPDV